MIYILYPSGSHGNFLKLLLHELTGIPAKSTENSIYDHVTYRDMSVASAVHTLPANVNLDCVINIKVDKSSYLKYFAVCLNRTSGHNIVIEDLHENTFDKVASHSIVSYFIKSLQEISGQSDGSVEPKYLREWFRLCFFAKNGETISKFISPNNIEQAKLTVNFESFYNGRIVDACVDICERFDLPITHNHKIDQHLLDFKKKNRYWNIDLNIDAVLRSIDDKTYIDLSQTNILQQAWIDNYLAEKYNIEPLLTNQYFDNTLELCKKYW